jgi:hypothetical protein
MNRSIAITIVLMSISAMGQQAKASIVINGVGYAPNGVGESLDATFTTPTGGVSKNLYSGLVEIAVSGTGFAFGPALNDAFYRYTDQDKTPITPENVDGHNQLAGDTKPLPENAYTHALINYIYYDVQTGMQVSPAYVPAYRSDHSYDVVVYAGTTPSNLYFGVADGVFSDNGGSYSITLTQLTAAAAVPEPTAAFMLALGLGGLAIYRRRMAR